jgi:uncharacterized protein (TIGR02145 family)
MENSFDVFISYSAKDLVIAEDICSYLEKNGVRCWMAPRDVRPGNLYGAEIVAAIKVCKVLVLVYSRHSNSSKHVINEIDIAFGKDKIIIPFKIEDTPLSESMEYYLNNKHWIDATLSMRDHFSSLLTHCKRLSQRQIISSGMVGASAKVASIQNPPATQQDRNKDYSLQSGNSGYFTDPRDGNQYKWVKIGNQNWMAENLRYMPHVSPANVQGGIWVYDYEGYDVNEAIKTENYKVYGCLYDWETAHKSCPPGWRLPADEDWNELVALCGGEKVAGGKLKAVGTKHWASPNEGADNSFNFSALPGGYRYRRGGRIDSVGYCGIWWSSKEGIISSVRGRSLFYNNASVRRNYFFKAYGFSVRCVGE